MIEAADTSDTQAYERDGYVALPGLFPREVLIAFYQRLQADLTGNGRSWNAYAARGPLLSRDAVEVYAHHYTPMLTFLWGLTPRMIQVTGRELLPTYAYFRIYQQGDICRVHSDRQSCEHSLSLTVAYADDKPWALSVAKQPVARPEDRVRDDFEEDTFGSVAMAPGDGVAYQGTHHRHGRVDPNPNRWSAHLFLHWIDRHGRYADHAFDRPALERAGMVR